MDKNLLSNYYKLRIAIDALIEELEQIHKVHLSCKRGCDLCCMAISVFPVEFYAIREELGDKINSGLLPAPKYEEDCRFLKNHNCAIYPSRPIICRTHGLPMLYMNSEGTEWELSHCELNFADFDPDEFSHENTYPQDTLNSKLFMINRDFVAKFTEESYSDQDRIPLSELI
jgi:Fe-S-cluster containining protein